MSARELTPIAIAVVSHAGTFLVGQRPPGVPLAGAWEFPGGKVHADESPEAAVVRECLEETGLRVIVEGTYPTADHDYEHARVRLHCFACRPLDLNRQPAAPFQWVPVEQLAHLPMPEANAPLVRRLLADAGVPSGGASA